MPQAQHLPTWQQLTPRYTFHTEVLADKDPCKGTAIRKALPPLPWYMLAYMLPDDPDFLDPPADGEFEVMDMAENEKAIFEWPQGVTADRVTGWISGWFGDTAQRIGERTWVV